jgi:ribose-phosphate pyrophosphokinase
VKGIVVELAIFSGSGNPPLAAAIASALGVPLGQRRLARSPDGELRVEIQENVRARDVFLVQPTGPPLDQNLMELLFLADACRRAGANQVTAVVPYFGYARQDRSASGQQALGARLIPDLLRMAGVGRVVTVDLHTTAVESAFGVALEHVSAVNLLCGAIAPPADSIVVAPDMGALRLAERYSRALGLPIAIVAKVRVSDEEVVAQNVIGEVQGRKPLIVDDIIITGATIEAALHAVIALGAVRNATVVATHGLFVGQAASRLRTLPITRLLVTDSTAISPDLALPIEVVTLAPLLTQVISRLHAGELLGDLIGQG